MQPSRTCLSERRNYYIPVLSYLTIQFISLGFYSVVSHIWRGLLPNTTGNCSKRQKRSGRASRKMADTEVERDVALVDVHVTHSVYRLTN